MEYMSFSEALNAVKAGRTVSRSRWEQNGSQLLLEGETLKIKNKAGGIRLRWIPVHEDLLAEDWYLVEEPEAGTEE